MQVYFDGETFTLFVFRSAAFNLMERAISRSRRHWYGIFEVATSHGSGRGVHLAIRGSLEENERVMPIHLSVQKRAYLPEILSNAWTTKHTRMLWLALESELGCCRKQLSQVFHMVTFQ